ncbi:hypothetical protein [Sorangium sp. So ce1389]|uniref:hypothetical protein n=1 Tax=Sorangium sp. So ce1389 TaxID=3133336 RepID=UPI003F60385F
MQIASCDLVEASSVRSVLQLPPVGAAAKGEDAADDGTGDVLSSAWAMDVSRGTARPMKTPTMPATSASAMDSRFVMQHLAATAGSLGVQAGKIHDLDSATPVE